MPTFGPGIAGSMTALFLTTAAAGLPPARQGPASEDRGGVGSSSVQKLETAEAQLAHADALRTSMRGKDGDAKSAARKAAIEAYRAVREYFGTDAKACSEASFHAGELLRSSNESSAALEEFQIAHERGKDSPFRVRAELEIAHIHRRGQDHEKALAAYEAVLADAAATPGQRDDASYWEGHVYLSSKRIDDARRAWQRVADTGEDPIDRIRAWDAIAGSFVDAGDLEGASGALEKCREVMAEAAAEETRLGERVRQALASMRSADDLQHAVLKREADKTSGKKTDESGRGDGRPKKK
jgi:tetratricopeptide (TPR) repeat protein